MCEHCKIAITQICPVYDLECVGCCARLVVSARPWKSHQEAMLSVISRFEGAPIREDVINGIKKGK
jgi:hypothetical protein